MSRSHEKQKKPSFEGIGEEHNEAFVRYFESIALEKQGPERCGPASLRVILPYFGIIAPSEDEIFDEVGGDDIKGVTMWDMAEYARRKFGIDFIKGEMCMENGRQFMLKRLQEATRANLPVMVRVITRFEEFGEQDLAHYVTVYKATDSTITYIDTQDASRKTVSTEEFLQSAEEAGYQFLAFAPVGVFTPLWKRAFTH